MNDERRFEKKQGFAIVLDITSSSKPLLEWPEDVQHEFFNGVFLKYSDALSEVLNDAEQDAVPFIQSTGDGLSLLVVDVRVGVSLCLKLQEVADDFAPRFRTWIEDAYRKLGIITPPDPFAYSSGIGMARGMYFQRQGHARPKDGALLGAFVGPAFVVATRISAKARVDKAIFSPLLDRTVVDAYRSDSEGDGDAYFFKVGEYVLNTKNKKETMLLYGAEGDNQTRELYSMIDAASPLVDVARAFDETVDNLYSGRYRKASSALSKLRSVFDGLGPEAPANRVVRRRWVAALSYIERKVQMSGYLP